MLLEESLPRVKLPGGREATPLDALRFCYNLSETDLEVLSILLDGGKYDVDTIAAKLGLSKATVNRALNKLISLGFIERERLRKSGAGRPKYLYYVDNPEAILKRIEHDFELCAEMFRSSLKDMLLSVIRARRAA